MKILLFGPFDEFNAFFRCECFIYKLKKNYPNIEITVSIPQKAISIIPSADEILTVEESFLKQKGGDYPNVLDILSDRNVTDFREYIISRIDITSFDRIWVYSVFDITDYFSKKEIIEFGIGEWFNEKDLGKTYFKRDIPIFYEWLDEGKTLLPLLTTFNKIKEKFGSEISDSYILITRNFKKKQPETNTHILIPNLLEIMEFLTEKGIKISNFGFPPSELKIISENYKEFNHELTQDEMMCLFYLSKGILLSGENGGWIIHSMSQNDMFLIGIEWGGMSISSHRNYPTTRLVELVNSNNLQGIYEILKSHQPEKYLSFSEDKKITIV